MEGRRTAEGKADPAKRDAGAAADSEREAVQFTRRSVRSAALPRSSSFNFFGHRRADVDLRIRRRLEPALLSARGDALLRCLERSQQGIGLREAMLEQRLLAEERAVALLPQPNDARSVAEAVSTSV